jgi:hypothetical protein
MTKDSELKAYQIEFRNKMKAILSKELESVIEKTRVWNKTGNGLGLPGLDLNEMVHYCRVLEDKCKNFQGRRDLLNACIDRIKGVNKNKHLLDVSLCIIGGSESGKTAMVSKLAECCSPSFDYYCGTTTVLLIVRYCGTSKQSVDALVLITSICTQIQLICNLPFDAISNDYNAAVAYFHGLLLMHPVLLFIDSLDQLTDAYQARSMLSFLVGVNCHKDTRIIVSALPDERDEENSNKWKYVYLCDTRLNEYEVPRVTVPLFDSSSSEAESLINGLLSLSNRKITSTQMKSLLESASVESTALYFSLSVGVVRHWESYFDIENQVEYSQDTNHNQIHVTVVRSLLHGLLDLSIKYSIILKKTMEFY